MINYRGSQLPLRILYKCNLKIGTDVQEEREAAGLLNRANRPKNIDFMPQRSPLSIGNRLAIGLSSVKDVHSFIFTDNC